MRGIAEAVYVGSSYGSGSLSLRIFATKLVMASVHGTLIKLLFHPRVLCEINVAYDGLYPLLALFTGTLSSFASFLILPA